MIPRSHRIGPVVAAVVVFLSLTFAGATLVYSFRQQESVDHRLCLGNVRSRADVRSTWEAARLLILQSPQNADGINEFFDAILETIPPLECIDNKPVVKEE